MIIMICFRPILTHPLEVPSLGALNYFTIGPFTPAGALWMCAAVAGAMLSTVMS